ncbi:hypothetical protein [Bradyrhizobium ottawaense]|uniref:hypothetical protein n=1 Tax=Bradyrhizobium ottawaense TaxID=931866 RepID=UPI0030F4A823
MFAGNEGGAETWAILASLIKHSKAPRHRPARCLTDVLERESPNRTKDQSAANAVTVELEAERGKSQAKLTTISSTAWHLELPAHR